MFIFINFFIPPFVVSSYVFECCECACKYIRVCIWFQLISIRNCNSLSCVSTQHCQRSMIVEKNKIKHLYHTFLKLKEQDKTSCFLWPNKTANSFDITSNNFVNFACMCRIVF
jgi:hypothetical protein